MGITLLPLLIGWFAGTSYGQMLAVGFLLGIAGASFAVSLPLASRWYPPEPARRRDGHRGRGKFRHRALDALRSRSSRQKLAGTSRWGCSRYRSSSRSWSLRLWRRIARRIRDRRRSRITQPFSRSPISGGFAFSTRSRSAVFSRSSATSPSFSTPHTTSTRSPSARSWRSRRSPAACCGRSAATLRIASAAWRCCA